MTEQRNAVAAIPENGLEISRLLTECSLLREKVKEDRARIAELEAETLVHFNQGKAAGEISAAERIAELEAKNTTLSILAKTPLAGWQKAEADAEKRRAEGLFNDNCGLKLRIAELEAAAQCVHDTFKSDLDQGYKTKDKVFAVEVLGKALAGKGE